MEIHSVRRASLTLGSTSVDHLPAEPIIDVDITVRHPDDEDAYIPALVALGHVMDDNARKEEAVHAICDRNFRSAGWR